LKTTIYIAIVLLTSFGLYSQQQDLFDRDWYATEMVVEGNTIPIPVLSVNSPQGCFVGVEIYSHDNNEASISLDLCWACQAQIASITDSTFESWGVVCLLCKDCGPCNPYGMEPICTEGYLSEFEHNQNIFFESIQEKYFYTITPLPEDHLQLKIDKPNGDYVIYTTESTLSIPENDIPTFSITPNPTSGSFALNGIKKEVKVVEIFNLNGSKISLIPTAEIHDISHLSAGLYFISVTTVDGQKVVRKLIKT
jgi:hypothetical protein